jgi:hypothetical protein
MYSSVTFIEEITLKRLMIVHHHFLIPKNENTKMHPSTAHSASSQPLGFVLSSVKLNTKREKELYVRQWLITLATIAAEKINSICSTPFSSVYSLSLMI